MEGRSRADHHHWFLHPACATFSKNHPRSGREPSAYRRVLQPLSPARAEHTARAGSGGQLRELWMAPPREDRRPRSSISYRRTRAGSRTSSSGPLRLADGLIGTRFFCKAARLFRPANDRIRRRQPGSITDVPLKRRNGLRFKRKNKCWSNANERKTLLFTDRPVSPYLWILNEKPGVIRLSDWERPQLSALVQPLSEFNPQRSKGKHQIMNDNHPLSSFSSHNRVPSLHHKRKGQRETFLLDILSLLSGAFQQLGALALGQFIS